MKLKNVFKIGVIAACLGFAVLGCEEKKSSSAVSNEPLKSKYQIALEAKVKEKPHLSDTIPVKEEFKILYLSIPRILDYEQGVSEARRGRVHEIEYVDVSNINGQKRLIYPFGDPIMPGNADIIYWHLKEGVILNQDLLRIFVCDWAETSPDYFYLKADGIIVPDTGVIYK